MSPIEDMSHVARLMVAFELVWLCRMDPRHLTLNSRLVLLSHVVSPLCLTFMNTSIHRHMFCENCLSVCLVGLTNQATLLIKSYWVPGCDACLSCCTTSDNCLIFMLLFHVDRWVRIPCVVLAVTQLLLRYSRMTAAS